jgi:hypothetical protein
VQTLSQSKAAVVTTAAKKNAERALGSKVVPPAIILQGELSE